MSNIILNPTQVTPDWLTAVLREHGTLSQGQVTAVTPDQGQSTFASCVWRLAVSYSADATPGAPAKLFLKLSNPALAPGEFDPQQMRREIDFYRMVAPAIGETFTIPCYAVDYQPETGASNLLLKDVSETHVPCLDPACRTNCEQAVDALARLHAFWWDHPRLGRDIGSFSTPEERQQGWIDTQKCTAAFIDILGDRLPRPWRDTYQRVLKALPGLFQRHAIGRNLTLVHGDAHLGNFLFPIDPDSDPTYMLDWQFWHPTIGGTDLAFMIATGWETDIRRALEGNLLRRYYAGLLARGVQGYTWDECWDDYRLSVMLVSIFIPVWQTVLFKWQPNLSNLERSMTAFEDLMCAELLA